MTKQVSILLISVLVLLDPGCRTKAELESSNESTHLTSSRFLRKQISGLKVIRSSKKSSTEIYSGLYGDSYSGKYLNATRKANIWTRWFGQAICPGNLLRIEMLKISTSNLKRNKFEYVVYSGEKLEKEPGLDRQRIIERSASMLSGIYTGH